MPSVWTRSADELHREYIANTEALYRAAGRAAAGELDGFMRSAALWVWRAAGAVTESCVGAYNALYSKGKEPPSALLWDPHGPRVRGGGPAAAGLLLVHGGARRAVRARQFPGLRAHDGEPAAEPRGRRRGD